MDIKASLSLQNMRKQGQEAYARLLTLPNRAIKALPVMIHKGINGLLQRLKALYQHVADFARHKIQIREERALQFKRFSRIGIKIKKNKPKTIPLIEFFGIGEKSQFQEKIFHPLTHLIQLTRSSIRMPLKQFSSRIALRHDFSPEQLSLLENLCKDNHIYGWTYQRNDTQHPYISIMNENGHIDNILIKKDHLAIIDSPRHSHIIYDAVAKIMRALDYPVIGICNKNNRPDNIIFSAEKILNNSRIFVLENTLFCKTKISYEDILRRSKNPHQEDLLRRLLTNLEKNHRNLYQNLPDELTVLSKEKEQIAIEEDEKK